jgi:hypothetical protein
MSSTPFSPWIRTSESILRIGRAPEEMDLVTQLRSYGRGFSQGLQGKDFQNRAGLFVGAESRGTSIPAEGAITIVKYCDLASADEEAPFAAIAVV